MTGASPFTVEGERNSQADISRYLFVCYFDVNLWCKFHLLFCESPKVIFLQNNNDCINSPNHVYRRIMTINPPLPRVISAYAQDFILRLLHKDPPQRLGAGPQGFQEIKGHLVFQVIQFFNKFQSNWLAQLMKKCSFCCCNSTFHKGFIRTRRCTNSCFINMYILQ